MQLCNTSHIVNVCLAVVDEVLSTTDHHLGVVLVLASRSIGQLTLKQNVERDI